MWGWGGCICMVAKVINLSFIFYLLINACTVKSCNFAYLRTLPERFHRVYLRSTVFDTNDKHQERSPQINFWTSIPVLNSPYCNAFPAQSPRIQDSSLFSHPLCKNGINKSILRWLDSGFHQPLVNPQEHLSAGTRWCIVWRLGECSFSCFSMRSRDQYQTMMVHAYSPPLHLCWSLLRISMPKDTDNMKESISRSWNINYHAGKSKKCS